MSGFVMLGNGCGNTTRRAIWRCRAAVAWLGPERERDWYYANRASAATPDGFAQEETIRAVWAGDATNAAPGELTPAPHKPRQTPRPGSPRPVDQRDGFSSKGRRPKVNPRPPVRLPRKCSLLSDSQSIAAARVRAAHGARRFPGSPVPGGGVRPDRQRWPVGQPRSRPRIACPWHSGGWQSS